MRRAALALLAGAFACATPKPNADSTTVATAIDTMKPAVVAAPDSVGGSTGVVGASAKAATKTTSKSPSTATKTSRDTALVARDTAHLGRDSVIRINPRDPKRTIPTQKKP